MRAFRLGGFVLAAVSALATLADCSGVAGPAAESSLTAAAGSPRSPAGPSIVRRATAVAASDGVRDLFVSDYENDDVLVFDAQTGRMIRKLTGFLHPAGITTDRDGNLYVADSGDAEVKIYAPPYANAPTTTIADAGEVPVDVAVSSYGFAVTNLSTTSQGRGSIMIFAPNATTPCVVAVYASPGNMQHFQTFQYAAYDSRDNLYVDGTNGAGVTSVGVVRGASCNSAQNFKEIKYLRLPKKLGAPGGIAVDKADSIVIADPVNRDIDVYPAFETAADAAASLGTPTTIPLGGSARPEGVALDSTAATLYAADETAGSALQYTFPVGTAGTSVTGFAHPYGIAVTPAVLPALATMKFLTGGTSWVVPNDWNPANNEIEVIGGGGAGGLAAEGTGGNGGGGGGGGYAALLDAPLTPGSTVPLAVGAGGTTATGNGGDTYLCSPGSSCGSLQDPGVIVGAGGGAAGNLASGVGGAGGTANVGTGTTGFPGGEGGSCTVALSLPGGGGAAGPHGAGGAGGGCGGGEFVGGGGGGADGGSVGNDAGDNGAGTGGNNYAGTGGGGIASSGNGPGDNGTDGGGGGGGAFGGGGGNGGAGTEFDATHGSGGGGGGGGKITAGGSGGSFGGGGGGTVDQPPSDAASGGGGLIVLIYPRI
jgi:hypothetical protein